MMLYRKHEPTTWADYVGQPKAVERVRKVLNRAGFDRGAFWIECAGANNSGTGKTTLARIIAGQLADPFMVTELDGARCSKSAVEGIESASHLSAWGDPSKPYRVWIINEAHAMTQGAVDLFLTFLEAMPRHCVVIFTTTRAVDDDLFGDRDSGPFASRCHRVRLTNQGVTRAYAERLKHCCQLEGIDGVEIERYIACMRRNHNNLRGGFQEAEAGTI